LSAAAQKIEGKKPKRSIKWFQIRLVQWNLGMKFVILFEKLLQNHLLVAQMGDDLPSFKVPGELARLPLLADLPILESVWFGLADGRSC
jgi:hypothetical protein